MVSPSRSKRRDCQQKCNNQGAPPTCDSEDGKKKHQGKQEGYNEISTVNLFHKRRTGEEQSKSNEELYSREATRFRRLCRVHDFVHSAPKVPDLHSFGRSGSTRAAASRALPSSYLAAFTNLPERSRPSDQTHRTAQLRRCAVRRFLASASETVPPFAADLVEPYSLGGSPAAPPGFVYRR